MDQTGSSRKSLSEAFGWSKAKGRSASGGLPSGGNSPLRTPNPPPRLPVPPETCVLLKYLIDFLIKSKLHKNDLFLLEAKPNERRKLLLSIQQGDIPEKLSNYSSRSVSSVVLELLTHSFEPLLPQECVLDFTRLEGTKSTTGDRVACVVRSMQLGLTPEQNALLESLLLLLYKLALKETAQMNARVLGETVGAKLVSFPSSIKSRTPEMAAVDTKIGRFLVENAPEILRLSRQKPPTRTHPFITSNQDPQTTSSSTSTDSSQAKANPLTNAAAIILGQQDSHMPRAVSESHSRRHRKPLDERTARGLTVALTAIIESKESKFGLYAGQLMPTADSDATVRRVKWLLVEGDVDGLQLLANNPVLLSLGLLNYLEEYVEPLLGESVVRSLASERYTDTVESSRIVGVLQHAIVRTLPYATQDVVLLLLATVRLALDAGTIRNDLEHHLAACLLGSSEDPQVQSLVNASVAVLFAETHSIVRLLLKKRERQASTRHLWSSLWVVCWVMKVRRQTRERRAGADRDLGEWEIVQSLCAAVEWLMDQTRVSSLQLRRLYLDADKEGEASIVASKILARNSKVDLSLFSPLSVASAIRTVLATRASPIGDEDEDSPTLQRLRELLRSHFDLLMRSEPSKRVRDELEQVLQEMLNGETKGNDSDTWSYNREDNGEAPVGDVCGEDAFIKRTASPATTAETLSEWLYYSRCESSRELESSDLLPSRYPPLGFSTSALAVVTNRLDDILFVMQSSCKDLTTSTADAAEDELSCLLGYLDIKPELISPAGARETLERVRANNRANKVHDATGLLESLQMLETLVIETVKTLQHPAFAALYPCLDDQLTVLLDIWGLADRSTTIKPSDFA